MKVICIDDSLAKNTNECPNFKVGESVDIIGENKCKDGFRIHQHQYSCINGDTIFWLKSRFVPLSEIDETEFVRDYNKQEA